AADTTWVGDGAAARAAALQAAKAAALDAADVWTRAASLQTETPLWRQVRQEPDWVCVQLLRSDLLAEHAANRGVPLQPTATGSRGRRGASDTTPTAPLPPQHDRLGSAQQAARNAGSCSIQGSRRCVNRSSTTSTGS